MDKRTCKIVLSGISLLGLALFAVTYDRIRRDTLKTSEICFRYSRFIQSGGSSGSGEGVDHGRVQRQTYWHELSVRSLQEMFCVLKREDFVRKVFDALGSNRLDGWERISRDGVMNDIASAEFVVDDQPLDANPVRGRIVVRSSTDTLARAIADSYAKLLRRLVEDEMKMRIDKSTMSFYSDYHARKKELSLLTNRMTQNGIEEDERRSIQENVARVKLEMERIEVEWRNKAEELRKISCSSIEFLDK